MYQTLSELASFCKRYDKNMRLAKRQNLMWIYKHLFSFWDLLPGLCRWTALGDLCLEDSLS